MLFDAFYSDPHFGHKNIIKYSNRPYDNVWQMNKDFIERYNSWIEPNYNVLFCGDIFFHYTPYESRQIMNQLPGSKYLVIGNHDPGPRRMLDVGFELVTREMIIKMGKHTCRVSHYPYALTDGEKARLRKEGKYVDERYLDRRPQRRQGERLIHGHVHSKKRLHNHMVHVGVDAWSYRPALAEEVLELLDR